MIKKYRKKPIVIEAIQWTGDNLFDVAAWMNDIPNSGWKVVHYEEGKAVYRIEISTLEGTMTAGKGDYIIKGIKGELYPCKADIFEASYDEVEE